MLGLMKGWGLMDYRCLGGMAYPHSSIEEQAHDGLPAPGLGVEGVHARHMTHAGIKSGVRASHTTSGWVQVVGGRSNICKQTKNGDQI